MRSLLFVLSLASLGILFSCSEDDMIERREDKLEGTWKFDKATYRERNELFGDDMMHRYRRDRITFYLDGLALYQDDQLREDFDGFWSVVLEYHEDDEGDEYAVFFVDMVFYENDTGDIRDEYYAEITWLTKNTLRLLAKDNRGEWKFKLKKV